MGYIVRNVLSFFKGKPERMVIFINCFAITLLFVLLMVMWNNATKFTTIMTVIGIIATIGAFAFSVCVFLVSKHEIKRIQSLSESSKREIENIRKISNDIAYVSSEIADGTRRPLKGIDEVLCQIFKMFKGYRTAVFDRKEKDKFDIWFMGLVLGLGPAHRVQEIEDKWEKNYPYYSLETGMETYDKFVGALINQFDECIKSAETKVRCVCLHPDKLHGSFFDALDQKYPVLRENAEIRNRNMVEVARYSTHLRDKLNRYSGPESYKEIETVPLQMLMTTIQKDKEQECQKAILVFNIGSDNVDSEVKGFYSESDLMYDLFKGYFDLLYKQGQNLQLDDGKPTQKNGKRSIPRKPKYLRSRGTKPGQPKASKQEKQSPYTTSKPDSELPD